MNGPAIASMKPGRQRDDLAVDAVEAVIAARLAWIALAHAAVEPGHAGFAGRPANERFDAGRQGVPAAILPVMDDERTRQRLRRAKDVGDILVIARGIGEE